MIKPIPDHIHPITLPTPFPVGPVHVYLLGGSPLTLVDTGPRTEEALEELEARLSELGHRLEDLEQIVITHSHADHYGLAATLVQRCGATVAAHSLCARRMERDGRGGGLRWYARLMRAAGVPVAALLKAAGGVRHVTGCSDPVVASSALSDGDVLTVGGTRWQILHLPGHSAGLICLYDPETRLLLGSDHLIKHISSNAIIEPPEPGTEERRKPLVEYWESLHRVEAMEVDLVLSGHGDPVADHRALIGRRFKFYSRRLDRMRRVLAQGPQTIWGLVQEIFPGLSGIDTFLSVSEILGHLDVLEEYGDVSVAKRRGVWYYEKH